MTITFNPRACATAPHGMVTCPHALASQAGVDALKAGGSAVDAAIAASSTLAVIYPHMTGLGGDAFWLIYDASAHVVRYLDGGGRAAASASAQWFHERGHTTEIPFRGVLPATLTTPGAVASWVEAHRVLWPATAEARPRSRHHVRARRLRSHPTAGPIHRAHRARAGAARRKRRDLHSTRQAPERRHQAHQPRPRAHARRAGRRRPRRLLRRRGGARDGALCADARRLLHRG